MCSLVLFHRLCKNKKLRERWEKYQKFRTKQSTCCGKLYKLWLIATECKDCPLQIGWWIFSHFTYCAERHQMQAVQRLDSGRTGCGGTGCHPSRQTGGHSAVPTALLSCHRSESAADHRMQALPASSPPPTTGLRNKAWFALLFPQLS